MIYPGVLDTERHIAELRAELAAKDAQLAAKDAQLAAKDARIAELELLVAELTARVVALKKPVGELLEELRRTSSNSHLPPSSDSPGQKKKRRSKSKKTRKSKRSRGGQPGHRGSHRRLLPVDDSWNIVHVFPEECTNCWTKLPEIPDPAPRRHQFIEIPPFSPDGTEWRLHAVSCPNCDHKTRARFDPAVIPRSPFGPRLRSLVGLLTGVYHVSRRKTELLLSDLCGVRISLGTISDIERRVSDALEPAVAEVCAHVEQAEVKHTDGTSWLQAGMSLSLWTIATCAATLFKIVRDSSKATLSSLFGVFRGILVSDRAAALGFWSMKNRQICWAHLLRKFVAFSERDGPAGRYGREFLQYTGLLFEYWHDYKHGKLDRSRFRAWMVPVRLHLEALLEKAAAADIERLSGSCANILAHREALWTFVERDDVEPTNNHAERELRAFVLWRKRSFGTQSARGNQFAERIMTVAHTARKQRKDVLSFLTACCAAQQDGTEPPSIFGAEREQTR